MPKLIEFVISAFVGAGASMLLARSEWWMALVWAVAAYGIFLVGKFIYGRTPMGKGKRERHRREAADDARSAAAARPGITMRNVTSTNSQGHGFHFGAGVTADMTDVRADHNKGDGFHFE